MLVLLDTSEDLDVCASELGCEVGQLITPLNGFRNRGGRWAMDNGAYSLFNGKAFLRRLQRQEEHRDRCLFVAAPDVVGSARRTLEAFEHWRPLLAGWPVAVVVQDGQEDLPIPWELIDAVFIGGTSRWKESSHAAQIVKAARVMGKWCHVGRINTPQRFKHFEELGADSCDGTGIGMYTHMREAIRRREDQQELPCIAPSSY